MTVAQHRSLYAMVWRWHFYAGLLVLPLVLVLSATGAVYLFKPQIERWEERAYQNLPQDNAVSPSAQVAAALASVPGARLASYRLPERPGDAAMIHLALPSGEMRDVFVAPAGQVLGSHDPEARLIPLVRRIHGQLLLGPRGSWLVELAASWAIVMICTGLYLWWPRAGGQRRLAGVVWPRITERGRLFWRDLHAVTGFWVSGLALVLLVTGLPWADVWGSAFKAVRTELGWVKGPQDWTIGGRKPQPAEPSHLEHDHAAMMAAMDPGHHHHAAPATHEAQFDQVVARASAEGLAFPVVVVPPGAGGTEGRFGTASPDWTVRSEAQNRPLAVTLRYDGETGREIARETFADKHPVDRVVGYGIAWHEGQLFGRVNQMVGLATALMLIAVVISGFTMWRRRKPAGMLGAPSLPQGGEAPRALLAGGLVLALLLPLFALSLAVLWLLDRFALPRLPAAARWLGMA